VIQYGTVEMQPNVVPTALSRHLTRNVPARRGLEGRWHRHVVSHVWPAARAFQRWASPRVGQHGWRVPPHRFAAELGRLVEVARAAGSRVVILDIHAPGPTYRYFFPGIERRWRTLQDVLLGVVESFATDPGVALLRASEVVASFGDDHVPDGMHWTPELHQAVADELVEIVRPGLAPDQRA